MYFTITTNRETAEQILKQCEFDAKHSDRSYELEGITHDIGFSVVKIRVSERLIKPADIFWLGRFSAIWKTDEK
jgi:hypothetical protein